MLPRKDHFSGGCLNYEAVELPNLRTLRRFSKKASHIRELKSHLRVAKHLEVSLCDLGNTRLSLARSCELKGVHHVNCSFEHVAEPERDSVIYLAETGDANLRAVAQANPMRPRYAK